MHLGLKECGTIQRTECGMVHLVAVWRTGYTARVHSARPNFLCFSYVLNFKFIFTMIY